MIRNRFSDKVVVPMAAAEGLGIEDFKRLQALTLARRRGVAGKTLLKSSKATPPKRPWWKIDLMKRESSNLKPVVAIIAPAFSRRRCFTSIARSCRCEMSILCDREISRK
jgi:hypothetical protein